jgi:FHA domain-containing protein/zinc ribbon protein
LTLLTPCDNVHGASRSTVRANVDRRPDIGAEENLTVFCTRCGHRNRDDARFCAECGAPLQDDSTVTLTPVEPDDDDNVEFPFPEDELEPSQALLQVKRGPNAGSTFLLDTDSTSVGRSTESAVFLDDITVSRAHATFERRPDGEWFVRDESSLNGTYVNGEQVDETKLATGDQVQIGRFRLTFFQAGE